nr:hypothetical protein [Streptomyces shenzhenensis]
MICLLVSNGGWLLRITDPGVMERFSVPLQLLRRTRTLNVVVVNQDRRIASLHIVRVEGANGEVVGGGVRVAQAYTGDLGVAGGGLEDAAGLEVLGLDEGRLGLVAEGG